MNLYASIARRKSCRQYDLQPLSQDFISEIDSAIKGFQPLFPHLPVEYRFVQRVKGLFHVNAPHYLIVGGKGLPGQPENTGFLFQQLVLWLDAMEIGSVWLGASRDAQGTSGKDIITIGFGRAGGQLHRAAEEFQRKPIESITNAPDDICIRAAHLAPSGMNTQPWYYEKQGDRVLLYQQKLKPPVSLIYKHSAIDMGISLCHYALACREIDKPFTFTPHASMAGKPGYIPFGIIE